jgi:peptide/nickel transport system permease protein
VTARDAPTRERPRWRPRTPSTHAAIARERLGQSTRFALGVVVLGCLALMGLFADLLASSIPLVARDPEGQVVVLPSLFERDDARRAALAPILFAPVRHGSEDADGPALAPPGDGHPLGTDARGRDVFARVAFGARTALGPALAAVAISMILGVVLGGAAGQLGGLWSRVLERLVQTVDTFPAILVVAIARAIERDPSSLSLVLGVAVVRWAEIARLVRAEVLVQRSEAYVMAARALGASAPHIFSRHLFRNALGPILVSSVFGVASVALLEAALSFLSLGAPVRQASWGETLAQAARHPGALHLLLPPALALGAMLGGSYLVADAVRDAIDPRTVRTTTRSFAWRRAVLPTPLASRDSTR